MSKLLSLPTGKALEAQDSYAYEALLKIQAALNALIAGGKKPKLLSLPTLAAVQARDPQTYETIERVRLGVNALIAGKGVRPLTPSTLQAAQAIDPYLYELLRKAQAQPTVAATKTPTSVTLPSQTDPSTGLPTDNLSQELQLIL